MTDEQRPRGECERHDAARTKTAAGRSRALGLSFLVILVLVLAGDGAIGWIMCAFAGGRDPVLCPAGWIGGHLYLYVAAIVVMAILLIVARRRKP